MVYDPEPVSAEPSPGWLCSCGNWQDDDFHCNDCGAEPPWGCPGECCEGACEDEEEYEDWDVDYYED